jgi:hypothetical protein
MGLIGTRSLTQEIPGINELVERGRERIRSGMIAYDALMTIRAEREKPTRRRGPRPFEAHSADLGFAFLLLRYVDDPRAGDGEPDHQAAEDTIPTVWPLFWAFRIMVALGFAVHRVMAYFFYGRRSGHAVSALGAHPGRCDDPAPWIAAELGWFVAEFGRQPWTVDGVLPTAMSVSHLWYRRAADHAGRLRHLLLGPVRRRDGPDGEIHPQGPLPRRGRETDAWMARHEHRLRTHDGNGPGHRNPCGVTDMILHELIDFDVLRVIWWLLLGVLLIGFALTDGFDMGVGALLPFVARTDTERRVASTPSARSGKATRSGSSWAAARSSPPGRRSTRSASRASTLRCSSCWRRSSCGRWRSSTAPSGTRPLAVGLGLGAVHRRRGARADLRRGGRQRAAGRALPPDRRPDADL